MAAKRYGGPERRGDKPGRRSDDYDTCMFHEGTCANIEELWKSMKNKAPIWVIALLVTVAMGAYGGLAFMIRDVRTDMKDVASNLHTVMYQQAAMLEKLKMTPPTK